jgi:hypothetical protein
MRKPYVRKLDTISKLTVWLVDGSFVRSRLGIEFTNLGHHYTFPFIPRSELWIDREAAPGEQRFFMDHVLVEHRLMAGGKGYHYALAQADRMEKAERAKDRLMRGFGRFNVLDESLMGRHAMDRIHKRLLRKYSRAVRVWIVDGELVRDLLYVDFTEGGHDRVYPFIPRGEVWLDDDLAARERGFVILHELHERRLMGRGWPYDGRRRSAHRDASRLEYFCRHHPRQLGRELRKEMEAQTALPGRPKQQ